MSQVLFWFQTGLSCNSAILTIKEHCFFGKANIGVFHLCSHTPIFFLTFLGPDIQHIFTGFIGLK